MRLDDPGADPRPGGGREAEVISLLEEAGRLVAEGDAGAIPAPTAQRLDDLFAKVENATPLGVSVHARLDSIRKWLAVLAEPGDQARFGGANRLRDHVITQLRSAEAAVRDYFGAQP